MAEYRDTVRVIRDGDPLRSKSYNTADIRNIFEAANPSSWRDAVTFINSNWGNVHRMTRGDVGCMKEDFQRAASQGAVFHRNPLKAYRSLR